MLPLLTRGRNQVSRASHADQERVRGDSTHQTSCWSQCRAFAVRQPIGPGILPVAAAWITHHDCYLWASYLVIHLGLASECSFLVINTCCPSPDSLTCNFPRPQSYEQYAPGTSKFGETCNSFQSPKPIVIQFLLLRLSLIESPLMSSNIGTVSDNDSSAYPWDCLRTTSFCFVHSHTLIGSLLLSTLV